MAAGTGDPDEGSGGGRAYELEAVEGGDGDEGRTGGLGRYNTASHPLAAFVRTASGGTQARVCACVRA